MRVGVVGGGLMGSGIAEVCARAGIDVTVVEVDAQRAATARGRVERSLARAVKAGKLDESGQADAFERLAFTAELEDLTGSDAAIEAIIESEEAKRRVFGALDQILPDAKFLASNTSSVPIMKLAAEISRPERVLGLHFFNPVPVLTLVEIDRSIMTSEAVRAEAKRFVHASPLSTAFVDRPFQPRGSRQPRSGIESYAPDIVCPTSIRWPSGSRM